MIKAGRRWRLPACLAFISCLMLLAVTDVQAAATAVKSHLTHYGSWKESDIPLFQRFGLVALQPGMYGTPAAEAQAIARVRSSGTLVLMYVSLGEDASTYNQGKPAPGDGRGPVRWNTAAGSLVHQNRGVASYYLDEWNAKGYDPDSVNKIPDGLPDRQGDWGSCLVNAGDTAWQRLILAEAARLMALGADGLFMDTPETASPWHGYGWTAPGMLDLIRKIREALPGKYLLLNRGLFFFDPDYPLQYRSSPRKYVDAVLFESYYTGSNYPASMGGNGSWRANPYFTLNQYITAPRLNAEMGRPDSYGSILHIDYAADPLRVALDEPALFQLVLQEVAVKQGWVPQINDRMLGQAPTAFLDFPAPPDLAPPRWQNTAVSSAVETAPPPGRMGLLKAIPGNGKVTLRWDVAADQTRPVRYNVYYSKAAPLDFATAIRLPAVRTDVGADYTDRARTGADDGCPYEFTVTGLSNNTIYRFAVRAEDGTASVAVPISGRRGPGGGIEETNVVVLMAAPRDSSPHLIAIDGAFADWASLPTYSDPAGDGSGADFLGASAADDLDNFYLSLEFSGTADPAKAVVLFNTDRRSHTGDVNPVGPGFRGADYKWEAGALYRHRNWEWIKTAAVPASRSAGNRLELRVAKKDLGVDSLPGMDLLAVSTDRREFLPDQGLTGLSYTFASWIPSGIRSRSGPEAQGSQRLVFAGGGSAGEVLLSFRNPRGRAEVRILDMRGRLLLRRAVLKGEETAWSVPAGLASLCLIRVMAEGMPPAAAIWMPPPR